VKLAPLFFKPVIYDALICRCLVGAQRLHDASPQNRVIIGQSCYLF